MPTIVFVEAQHTQAAAAARDEHELVASVGELGEVLGLLRARTSHLDLALGEAEHLLRFEAHVFEVGPEPTAIEHHLEHHRRGRSVGILAQSLRDVLGGGGAAEPAIALGTCSRKRSPSQSAASSWTTSPGGAVSSMSALSPWTGRTLALQPLSGSVSPPSYASSTALIARQTSASSAPRSRRSKAR